MSCVVYGELVGRWVAAQMNADYSPATCTAIGMSENGDMVGGIFFENFNGASIVAHLATTHRRLTRPFLHAVADYAFNKCKVNKIIAPVASTNNKMAALAWHMGFNREAVIKGAAPNGDLDIYTMTKAQCRFLEEKYGKTKSPARA